jgi:glycosyltransferase involved in cell wall biosynthesis
MLAAGYAPNLIETVLHGAPEVNELPISTALAHREFLFVGRLVPEKGLDWLLSAFSQIGSEAILHIAGAGPLEGRLRALASAPPLQDRVVFHGWLEASQLRGLYERCRALIVPSVWPEPAGLVNLEAQAHGRPVIASAVGGIPEYVENNVAGLLINPQTPSALAQAIERLVKDDDLVMRLGQNGRRRAVESSFSRHAERVHCAYEALVS